MEHRNGPLGVAVQGLRPCHQPPKPVHSPAVLRNSLLVLLSVALAAPALAQQPAFPVNLRQGIMAGEVGETSAILQSRLTDSSPRQNPAWEGVRGIGGWARFEISPDADFEHSWLTEWIEATPFEDFIVKTRVGRLQPGTRYHYRLHYGRNQQDQRVSDAATFRTLAGAEGTGDYSMTIVTGMNYSFFHYTGNQNFPPYSGPDKDLGYPTLKTILSQQPDFFVGTGDNVYYDHPGHRGRAQTPHEMRKKHHEQYSQQRFLDLFQKTATYWMKDDHDHRFDDSDAVNAVRIRTPKEVQYYPKTNVFEGESGSGFLPTHEQGIEMFLEQMPVVDPSDPDPVTYRTHRVSRDLQIWFVEGRDYRDPLDMPDNPQKTIWGKKQKAWLKQTLLDSDATFKLLISPTPMVGPDDNFKRDNHTDFNGYRYEGDEFFEWLQANDFDTNEFFIACGDRHWQYHAIHPSGYEEFSSGALVDQNARLGVRPGSPNSTDPEGKIRHVYQYDEPTGGFLNVSLHSEGDQATLTFRFFDEAGKLLHSAEKRSR